MLPLTGDEKGLELGGFDIQRRQARVERFKGLDGKKNQRTIDGVHVRITEPKFRFLLLSAVVFACDDGDPGTRSVSSVRRKTLFAFEGDFCE
jgi:hypothetical protein